MHPSLKAALVGAGIGSGILNFYLLYEIYKETKRLEAERDETLDTLAWVRAYQKISRKISKFGIYADHDAITRELLSEYEFQKIVVHEN